MNPALGNETLLPLTPAPTREHVVVVGAGPAGLESALVLTERGHRVTVLDKADRLGGTMWFSTLTTPDRRPRQPFGKKLLRLSIGRTRTSLSWSTT